MDANILNSQWKVPFYSAKNIQKAPLRHCLRNISLQKFFHSYENQEIQRNRTSENHFWMQNQMQNFNFSTEYSPKETRNYYSFGEFTTSLTNRSKKILKNYVCEDSKLKQIKQQKELRNIRGSFSLRYSLRSADGKVKSSSPLLSSSSLCFSYQQQNVSAVSQFFKLFSVFRLNTKSLFMRVISWITLKPRTASSMHKNFPSDRFFNMLCFATV